ncbi:hypothetical protein HDU88_006982 [Geranomyces variabilis]|nr:hypothetical protein HDU88_006982 [Geranomyces variabilis]
MANYGAQAASDLPTTWAQLETGIDPIMNKLSEGLSYKRWMDLYTLIYNYCTSSRMYGNQNDEPINSHSSTRGANLMGADLYQNLKKYLKEHLDTLKASADAQMDEDLLLFYTKEWKRYTTATAYVNHVFAYLNRHWVKREIDEGHKNIYDVYTLTLVTWRDHFFGGGPGTIQPKIMDAVLKLIEKQRNGETIDSTIVNAIVDSFVSLGLDENDSTKPTLDVYKQYFETPFIAKTEAYYKMESERFISENTIVDYMKKAEMRLAEEDNRVQMYLHSSSQKPLLLSCETVLIKNHTGPIQEEFQNLLDQDKTEDLSRMYGLLSRVPDSLEKLRHTFEVHVRKQGLSAVEKVAESAQAGPAEAGEDDEEEDPKPKAPAAGASRKPGDVDSKTYVDALLSVHAKYSDLVKTAFKGETGFEGSLDRACREFVNRNVVCEKSSSKSPELLAKHCDSLLKKGSKITDEHEVEEVLNSVMTLFKYVEDKDVFQKFYQKQLARRLVNAQSANGDTEESMINKLKDACGFEFTSKLQRMFQDVALSKDLNDQFKEQTSRTQDKVDGPDFQILVGGTGQWPLNAPSTAFNIPDDLLKTYERFQNFYQHKFSGRKLNWLFHLGRAEIKANYVKTAGKTPFTFLTSTYQMGVLLQFNTATSYTFKELATNTSLDTPTLKSALYGLLKSKTVTVDNSSKVWEPENRWELNLAFKSKKTRIKVDVPMRAEQKAESEETHKGIEEDRSMVIQAAIVRIMKTRKMMQNQVLVTETIEQLKTRFKPTVSAIKKCIDMLLEKEYIERMEKDREMFAYVA